jgi:hypothetical protein
MLADGSEANEIKLLYKSNNNKPFFGFTVC